MPTPSRLVSEDTELRDAVGDILTEAARSDVDVRGGWNVRNPESDGTNWTVE